MKRTPHFLIALIAALMCLCVPASAQSRAQIDRIQDSIQVLRDLTQQNQVELPPPEKRSGRAYGHLGYSIQCVVHPLLHFPCAFPCGPDPIGFPEQAVCSKQILVSLPPFPRHPIQVRPRSFLATAGCGGCARCGLRRRVWHRPSTAGP